MAEIISLSSEDEGEAVVVPRKRIKLISLPRSTSRDDKLKDDSCIVIDDDDDDCKEIKIKEKPAPKPEEAPKSGLHERSGSFDVKCVSASNESNNDIVQVEQSKTVSNSFNFVSDSINGAKLPPESASGNSDVDYNFFAFLDDCIQALKNPKHRDLVWSKLPLIKKLYEKLKKRTYNAEDFEQIVKDNTEKIKNSSEQTIIYFNEVFQWLKSSYKDAQQAQKSIEQNHKIIKKLDKALPKLRRKIRELEQEEVSSDDEENSAYIQLGRYMQRADQIYSKLCKYRGENPNHGRLLYCRLDFSASKFSEINRALNRKYKNNAVFPTYYDVEKCIRKSAQENNLKMTEDELKYEVNRCFEKLGKLMQQRRKIDLYHTHRSYIENTSDPALEDTTIDVKIRAHRSEADKKLEQVYEKYSQLQDEGVDPEVSPESEDSDVIESGSECEQDENATENI